VHGLGGAVVPSQFAHAAHTLAPAIGCASVSRTVPETPNRGSASGARDAKLARARASACAAVTGCGRGVNSRCASQYDPSNNPTLQSATQRRLMRHPEAARAARCALLQTNYRCKHRVVTDADGLHHPRR
jgi:hypothetical protein